MNIEFQFDIEYKQITVGMVCSRLDGDYKYINHLVCV